jgi:hypothetical protein
VPGTQTTPRRTRLPSMRTTLPRCSSFEKLLEDGRLAPLPSERHRRRRATPWRTSGTRPAQRLGPRLSLMGRRRLSICGLLFPHGVPPTECPPSCAFVQSFCCAPLCERPIPRPRLIDNIMCCEILMTWFATVAHVSLALVFSLTQHRHRAGPRFIFLAIPAGVRRRRHAPVKMCSCQCVHIATSPSCRPRNRVPWSSSKQVCCKILM